MDTYIGQIAIFAFNFSPANWAPCNGQLLPIAQNQALFSLIGVTFGGDGRTDFQLPDYQTLAPKGSQYCIALQGVYPQR
jgi:microcystin-dependent protein